MTVTEDQDLITEAMHEFPQFFKLRGWPGKRFIISLRSSYIRDDGVIMLYCQVEIDGRWVDHSKGTVEEYRREIVP